MNFSDSKSFFRTVESAFSFLRSAGFTFPESGKESGPTYDSILIQGKNVAFEVSLDRRDGSVDFAIARVKEGRIIRNDVPGGYWSPFHGYLVDRRNYRGGLSEFYDASQDDDATSNITAYAKALRVLAPDAAADSAEVFR